MRLGFGLANYNDLYIMGVYWWMGLRSSVKKNYGKVWGTC